MRNPNEHQLPRRGLRWRALVLTVVLALTGSVVLMHLSTTPAWAAMISITPTPTTATTAPAPTATTAPAPTATTTSPPTATTAPVPTATSVPAPTATTAPAPTATTAPMPTATSVPMPTATTAPAPTATTAPAPTATSAPAPTATRVPVPTATGVPSPTATSVPVPTATSSPVHTATNLPAPINAAPISVSRTSTPNQSASSNSEYVYSGPEISVLPVPAHSTTANSRNATQAAQSTGSSTVAADQITSTANQSGIASALGVHTTSSILTGTPSTITATNFPVVMFLALTFFALAIISAIMAGFLAWQDHRQRAIWKW